MELTMVPFHGQSSEEKPDPASARYRECLRNHAAALGGLANDGCGEFMEAASSPLLCAACGCHRNFHRKELPALVPYSGGATQRQQYYMSSRFVHGAQRHAMMLCGPAQMVEPVQAVMAAAPAAPEEAEASATRKRYRTKFTAEQKEKMADYAERRGWRVGGKGEDEEELRRFCDEVGVTPHVLRVWVHNHRHAAARVAAASAAAGDDGGCRVATDAAAAATAAIV